MNSSKQIKSKSNKRNRRGKSGNRGPDFPKGNLACHTVFSQKRRATLSCSFMGYAAAGITNSYNSVTIQPGQFPYPFNTSEPITGIFTISGGGLAVGANKWAGGTAIAAIYNMYKAFRTRIQITPQQNGSDLLVWCVHATNELSIVPTTMQVAMSQPYSVHRIASSGNSSQLNKLELIVDHHKVFGMTLTEYKAMVPTTVGTVPPTNFNLYIVISFSDPSSGNTAGQTFVNVELDTEFEFSELGEVTNV